MSTEDAYLVGALRAGDETAFISLIEHYHGALVRQATIYLGDSAIAEEVAQETWIGVLQGLKGFEGRSSLKTWIFSILINRAKTRAIREGHAIPFSALEDNERSIEADRFEAGDPQWAGWWKEHPRNWDEIPEANVLSAEVHQQIEDAIHMLPPSQREIITLRDVQGLSCNEVCNLLDITKENQRVLLHRARSKVRRALEMYFGE